MPRTLLVTGAAGYVGSQVTAALAREPGVTVVGADVRPCPVHLREVVGAWVELDTRSPDLQGVLEQHAVDVVVHLACIVSPPPTMTRAEQHSIDVEGAGNVVAACVAAGVRKLVVTSSGAVYGYHADNSPLLTEDDPLRGHEEFAYAQHKVEVEALLEAAREEHPELTQLVFRPCTVLGASVRNDITALFDARVVVGLSDAATPFVFVWDEDVVRCLVQGALGPASGVFNLAGDGVMTLREIAAHMGKPFVGLPAWLVERGLSVLKRWSVTRYGPEQVCFLRYRPVLSNERLKQDFGYLPRRSTRQVFDLFWDARRSTRTRPLSA